jgi:hypothetical protein
VRTIKGVLGVLALTIMAALLLGAPASAAPAPAPVAVESAAEPEAEVDADYCDIDAPVPLKFGSNVISGYGRQTCYGAYQPQQVKAWLQRSRWYGWENVASCETSWTNDQVAHCSTGSFTCTGQYEYRTLVQGLARSGSVSAYLPSSVVTIGC